MLRLLLCGALLLALVLCGCNRPPAVASAPKTAKPVPQTGTLPHARAADDTARFVAGLPGRPGSPFTVLETEAAWKEHRQLLDRPWRRADADLIRGFREFHERELSESPLQESAVFYPFGGPDALLPTLCFPHSPVYVMVALEPAGSLPTLAEIQEKDLAKYLAALRASVASELRRSFFVTHEMNRDFRGEVSDGLLLPILYLLVRTNHTVLGFRYVRLDAEGQVVERTADQKELANSGVEVEFRTESDQSTHRLCYFSVNLADGRLRANKGFLAYIASLQSPVTLLKATSYLPHTRSFSMIRDVALTHSGAILQDDSGIPYRYFGPDRWKLRLYGGYTRPYGSFRKRMQPDLQEAYRTSVPKELPMAVGYGYKRAASNLLLAKRNR